MISAEPIVIDFIAEDGTSTIKNIPIPIGGKLKTVKIFPREICSPLFGVLNIINKHGNNITTFIQLDSGWFARSSAVTTVGLSWNGDILMSDSIEATVDIEIFNDTGSNVRCATMITTEEPETNRGKK